MSACPGLGFTTVIGLKAHERGIAAVEQRATQSVREGTWRLTSETEESGRLNEGIATRAIGESEEACEFAPIQAELAVKGDHVAQKTPMPLNRGQSRMEVQPSEVAWI
jgi:hypothetical protein